MNTQKSNQNFRELLEALSKIRETHPELYRHYINRLSKYHIKLIKKIKS